MVAPESTLGCGAPTSAGGAIGAGAGATVATGTDGRGRGTGTVFAAFTGSGLADFFAFGEAETTLKLSDNATAAAVPSQTPRRSGLKSEVIRLPRPFAAIPAAPEKVACRTTGSRMERPAAEAR
jgi:hypothetical protein